ncbi:SDR family NAD(P)-dependent oxidoreductase [Microbacterium gorillae]|uniref:SDR family NAD(P)-dependent oxidoreductase n=1 Tax=Microbacterium gorillae TaxID=1231063 RepID=UPI000590E939|nr:SDR family NAD(P)-dependent oxidoreductase [Microbacterium gorillae]
MQVKGTIAFVTGGASGLGRGVAEMVIAGGGRVVIADLASSDGAAVAAELGENALFVPVDVSDPDQVEAGFAAAVDRFGGITLAVNSAGVSPAARVVNRRGEMFPLDTFAKTLDINLTGAFDVVRHAARVMSANEPGEDGERGLIVNVSSAAGLEGQVGQAAYTASKGALAALTLQLARDLAVLGVRVMTVAPSIMDTGMLAGTDPERREKLLDIHTFPKRLGTAADFATLVKCFMEVTLLNGEIVRLDAATRLG